MYILFYLYSGRMNTFLYTNCKYTLLYIFTIVTNVLQIIHTQRSKINSVLQIHKSAKLKYLQFILKVHKYINISLSCMFC